MRLDDLDNMLQGENQDSPSESQTENANTGSNSEGQQEQAEGQEEKVEFDKLTGSAQNRFKKIYNERQKLLQEKQTLMQQLSTQPRQNTVQPSADSPEVKDAISKLDQAGIATKEFVQKQMQDILAQKTYYDELGKLEGQINGGDGRPAFTREEYFDFVDRHPQYKNYLPVDVYEKMYPEELQTWKAANGNTSGTRRTSQQLRPTRTASQGTELTVDDIEAKLKSLPEPQRSEWYNANLSKINKALQSASSSA